MNKNLNRLEVKPFEKDYWECVGDFWIGHMFYCIRSLPLYRRMAILQDKIIPLGAEVNDYDFNYE